MTEGNRMLESMMRVARERLQGRDPREIAALAGVQFEKGAFCFESLGRSVRISHPDCTADPPLPQWHWLTLLHYLDLADGTPLTGVQLPFARMRSGMVRGGGFDRDGESLIRDRLGSMDEGRLRAGCRALGAEILNSNADLCARFSFAPRCALWLKLWFADEEFEASGRIFIDSSADHYLTIEDAVTVGSLLLDALCASAEQA